MFYTYVLYSEIYDKIYIGFTSDLEKRLLSHNILAAKGWTIKYRPWKLVYTENFEVKDDAMRREKALKTSAGRRFIREHINKVK